jgi:hypothetical protein
LSARVVANLYLRERKVKPSPISPALRRSGRNSRR